VFKKILIADRGEIAVRIIRACREMKIATVAIYSEADEDALHVRLADETVRIGPPPMRESYLNIPNIIMAAVITGADAIHPGYGGLAEKPEFAENCEACNLTFIGPPPQAMELMGNKAVARQTMQEVGVPVVPGLNHCSDNGAEALRFAEEVGYPVIIKAAAGGGGRGMRLAHNAEDLQRAIKTARREAEAAFGDGTVYVEKYISEPRHIEVQILADQHGHVVHLFERECSIQTSYHQKMLEEAPSVAVNPALRHRLGEAAVKAARAVKYANAGTVEFLLDQDNKFYFMEMNTRVQVEHPVTECVTGLDLVKEQIRVAAGERLPYRQRDLRLRGHAIECRIMAVDPEQGFQPCTGEITHCMLPGGIGVRVDTHIYPGYRVSSFYDPLLAKVIAWGSDREEAISRMERALQELEIEGVKTNLDFHRRILANAFFRRGEINTNFLQRRMGIAV